MQSKIATVHPTGRILKVPNGLITCVHDKVWGLLIISLADYAKNNFVLQYLQEFTEWFPSVWCHCRSFSNTIIQNYSTLFIPIKHSSNSSINRADLTFSFQLDFFSLLDGTSRHQANWVAISIWSNHCHHVRRVRSTDQRAWFIKSTPKSW